MTSDILTIVYTAVAILGVVILITRFRLNPAVALVVGGGFSANSQLREMAAKRCAEAGIELRIPPIRYCTDNGAMIAALGSALVRAGVAPSPLDLAVDSSMALSLVSVPA